MKRLAFLTALIAGGSAAYAQPWYHPYNRDTYREPYRTENPYERRQFGWEAIADRYSTDSARQFINPGDRAFRRLRIEVVEGRALLTKIVIEFANGGTQVLTMRRPLSAGYNRVRDIDLNGGWRRINRIVVYSDPRFQGSFSIFGT